MNATTATSVAGSVGLTLNSCVCRNRVSRNDAPTPTTRPDDGEQHALAEHHPEHALPRGAHRHVNADLLPALAHRVREDAVGADRRQRERQAGGNHRAARARNRGRATVSANTSSIVRSFTSGSVGSIAADHAPDVGGERVERQRRTDHDVHVARREVDDARSLFGEKVDLRPGLLPTRPPA